MKDARCPITFVKDHLNFTIFNRNDHVCPKIFRKRDTSNIYRVAEHFGSSKKKNQKINYKYTFII